MGQSCWGRTGFDQVDALEAACRGWFVGLVNHSNQKLVANNELALAA
jgi:beta-lactamase class D